MSDVEIALVYLAVTAALGFWLGWVSNDALAAYRRFKATHPERK